MEEEIEAIMAYFDFERVHRLMVADNWQWSHADGVLQVPSLERIKECARRNLVAVTQPGCWGSGSGGFRAEREGDMLKLSFVVRSLDSEDALEYRNEAKSMPVNWKDEGF
jgi:hypothetical protein